MRLDDMVNEDETLRQYIYNSEKAFGLDHADVDNMNQDDLAERVEILDYLWTK